MSIKRCNVMVVSMQQRLEVVRPSLVTLQLDTVLNKPKPDLT